MKKYDVVIIGGGPAGLAAGLYAGRAKLKTLVLEKQKLGGQIVITAEIDNYPGAIDGESGPSLIDRMTDQARKFGVEIMTNCVGIKSSLAGTIMAVALFIEVIAGMAVGNYSDQCTSKLGKRRPFILAATIAMPIIMVLMFTTIKASAGLTFCYYLIISIFFRMPKQKIVVQNCAAVPDALMESILFGSTRGSFTGAENKKGLFEEADGGIFFLDELNAMPYEVQGKLLRVLQDGTFRPIGSNREKRVNVKIIAAMNVDPIEAMRTKPD